MSNSVLSTFVRRSCLLILLGATCPLAQAQRTPPRRIHTIEVVRDGGVCYYEIKNQTAQDTLHIAPGGKLIVRTRHPSIRVFGMPAHIRIKPDSLASGVAVGTPDTERTSRFTRQVVFTIRSARGRATSHPVEIDLPACRLVKPLPHHEVDGLPQPAVGGPIMKVED